MTPFNQQRALQFSDQFVECYLVENVKDFTVEAGVVVNLDYRPMSIGGPVPSVVPAWKSTMLFNAVVAEAARMAVFRVRSEVDLGGIVLGEWDWFGNRFAKFPRTTPLYISRYDEIGAVRLDPFAFANQREAVVDAREYAIRLNLWWAPTNTDCYLHNEHPFVEIHTQIHGAGRIQLFRERDASTLYRQISMAPGYTHDPFTLVDSEGSPTYPWHRYWSDSDAIWLAIEFHPKG
ncbi:hypothetical protein [Pseudomonas sp. S5D5]|uniref:hypothetical protein n=1 Tax=Pseudomonas sp. S5D5 TaxID=2083056 RepID=UPI000D0F85AB|nr:hypothetical protein [Pseudomonas sp. S5D5]